MRDHEMRVQSLAAAVAAKRVIVDALGLMNVAQDEAGRMRQSIQHAQARAALMNAEGALRDAITESEMCA